MSACPTTQELRRLLEEDLGSVSGRALEPHVEGCPHCQQQMERLAMELSAGECSDDAPAATSPWPRLAGYEILGELGRGGMGVVYQARQTCLDRLVAVKLIAATRTPTGEARLRFRQE